MFKLLLVFIIVVISAICKGQTIYLQRAESRHKMLMGTWVYVKDTAEIMVFEKDSIRMYRLGQPDTCIFYYSMTSAYSTPRNENLSYTPLFRVATIWSRMTRNGQKNKSTSQLGSVPVKLLTSDTLEMNWDCNPNLVNNALVYKRKK